MTDYSASRPAKTRVRDVRFQPRNDFARWRTPLLLGILIILLAGCGRFLGQDNSVWTVEDTRDDTFSIEVRNDNFNQARIFALWNGDRRRLGSVGGNQSETFTIDWRTQDLRLEVDFLAGGGFVSNRITVNPGDRLFFRIPAGAR